MMRPRNVHTSGQDLFFWLRSFGTTSNWKICMPYSTARKPSQAARPRSPLMELKCSNLLNSSLGGRSDATESVLKAVQMKPFVWQRAGSVLFAERQDLSRD